MSNIGKSAGNRGYSADNRPIWMGLYGRVRRPYGVNADNGFGADQPAMPATIPTLASAAALNATSLTVQAGEGASFIAGEPVVVGSGSTWRLVTVSGVSGDVLSIRPNLDTAMDAGAQVCAFWYNASHPTLAAPNKWMAYWVANALLHDYDICGADLLGGYGAMSTRYTDTNGKANAPAGWVSVGDLSSFVKTSFSPTTMFNYNQDANGIHMATAGTDTGGAGMQLVTPIPVQPGQEYVLSWLGMGESGRFEVDVYDVTNSAVITPVSAPPNIGASTSGAVANCGVRTSLRFTVPYGCAQIRVRVLSVAHSASAYAASIDDMYLVRARSSVNGSRYVVPDGDLLVIGDSWGAGSVISWFRDAWRARVGTRPKLLNRSMSGYKLYQLQPILRAALQTFQPATVLHYSGLQNDLRSTRTQSQLEADMDLWIDTCRQAGARPVFLGGAPVPTEATTDFSASLARDAYMRARVLLHTL